jgi:Rha family phage regulatory protein
MQLVITYKEKVTTTSLLVAEKFGKEHKNVLEDIQNLECSPIFRELNFEPSSYKSAQNKDMPVYILTRDAFTMLVMSFTGSSAAKFREEFIEEFNRMEAVLRQGKTPVLIPTYQMRILSESTKSCPYTHWNIFDASHSIMMLIEKHIGSVNKYDLVDGSIGYRWAKYREGKDWAVTYSFYTHEYDDARGSVECKCYQHSEFGHFKKWLNEVYKQTYLPEYLKSKYEKERNAVMLDKVHEILPKLLKAS